MYEFFGEGFIPVEVSRTGWEKALTWNSMKDALNKRGKPEKSPQSAVEGMDATQYDNLMALIRAYRSPELLHLTEYRGRRTHRVAPTVDHPELGVALQALPAGQAIPLFQSFSAPEYDFLHLYATAKEVYAQLQSLLTGLCSIVHA